MRILVVGNFKADVGNAPYKRINQVLAKISEIHNIPTNPQTEIISLNKALCQCKITMFYPLYFFVTFLRCQSILSCLKQSNGLTLVYFYGRNLSLFLAVYSTLIFRTKNLLMVDHVENPIFLYKFRLLFSNLMLDQFLGYPFLWKLSNINLIITKSYIKSIFYSVRSTIYMPIIISENNAQAIIKPLKLNTIDFCMISSLASRDAPLYIKKFIEIAKSKSNVNIHIIGRFKNREMETYLTSLPNVKLYNNADEDVKNHLLNTADFFILFRNFRKAEYYSSPTRLAEFIEYQKPILVNQSKFVKEILGSDYNGYYEFNLNDSIESIVFKMRKIVSFGLDAYYTELGQSMLKLKSILDESEKKYL